MEQNLSFEDFKNQNGMTYWWSSDLMAIMGYTDNKQFKKVVNRATKALLTLNIDLYDNIVPKDRIIEGNITQDLKLSRFACYLIIMNGDPHKIEVANAQKYFAERTRAFELIVQDQDRLVIRDDIKEGNKALASTAKDSGVVDFARFQNAGYLGMYNMPSWKLAKKRNIDKKKIFDTMGRTEMAANLFRITQTEERIITKNVNGQSALEQAHRDVGKTVREIIQKNTNTNPEDLPTAQNTLPDIRKNLKKNYTNLKKIDK